MVLWKFTLRELKSHPGRATLTLLSIVIAVSAAVAVKVSTATTRQAYQEMYVKLAGRAALEVVPDGEGTFDESIVGKLEKIPGVTDVAPALQLPTILHFKDGDPHTMLVMGIDPARDEKVRDYELAAGSFFRGDEGGLMEAGFARSLGIEVGDEVRLMTKRLRQGVPIVGLLTPKGVAGFKQGATITLTLRTVQRLFGQPRMINNASLVLDSAADVEKVRQAVDAVLPPGVTVRMPTSRAQLGSETLATFDQGLTFAYTLTLVLATIVILNTFLMNVGERRRQLAILRTLGTTRRQIMGMLLREGLLMGAVGTVAGLVLGMAGAYGLNWVMAAKVFETSVNTLQIGREPFILAGLMGPGMALVAMFIPAYLAGKVTPLEGMRPQVAQDGGRISPILALLGFAAFAVTGAALVATVFGWLPIDMATPIGVLFTVSLILLIPAVLNPLSALCTSVLRPLFRTEAMLAHRQVVRRRTRSTLTVGVLYVALSAGIGLGTAILNNVQDVRTWQERTFIGAFFIRANKPDLASGKSAPMPDSVETEIRGVAGVQSVDGVRVVEQVTIKSARGVGEAQEVGTVLRDFGAGDRLPMDLKVGDLNETRARLRAGEVVIGTVVAHRMGIGAGDEIVLQTRQGPKNLRIAGETNDYWLGGRVMYMERSLGKKLLGADGADMYIVHVPPAALTEVEDGLKAICSRDGFSILSFAGLRRRLDDLLNSIVAGLWGIMALGLIVAGFAVANTLTMNVLEQTREIAMLRVVAMTRRQVRRTILAQAAILGLFGVTLGVISGAISSYTMNLCTPAVTGRPIDFALHPGLLIGTYLVSLGIILIAAWLPARRATHLNLLIALQYE